MDILGKCAKVKPMYNSAVAQDILISCLLDQTRMLWYLFPDGRGLERACEGLEGSPARLMALWVRRMLKMSIREGRGAPIILLAVISNDSQNMKKSLCARDKAEKQILDVHDFKLSSSTASKTIMFLSRK